MSDPVTNVEIEDVLSSIRRLVSEDSRKSPPRRASDSDKLVLTPAQRVRDETEPVRDQAGGRQDRSPVLLVNRATEPETSADDLQGSDAKASGPMVLAQEDVVEASPDRAVATDLPAEIQHIAQPAESHDAPAVEDGTKVHLVPELPDEVEIAQTARETDLDVTVPTSDDKTDVSPIGRLVEEELAKLIDDAMEADLPLIPDMVAAQTGPGVDRSDPETGANAQPHEPVVGDLSDNDALSDLLAQLPDNDPAASHDVDSGEKESAESNAEPESDKAISQPETETTNNEEGASAKPVPKEKAAQRSPEFASSRPSATEAQDDGPSLERKIAALEDVVAQRPDQWDDEGTIADAPATFIHRPMNNAWDEPQAPRASSSRFAAKSAGPTALIGGEGVEIDEEILRDMVADIVRQELQGALGERITRNVRKLVRREIHRVLLSQDFD